MIRFLTMGEKLFLDHQRQARRQKKNRFLLGCLFCFGFGNLFAAVLANWFGIGVVTPSWFVYGSLALIVGSFLALKVLWL